MTEEQTLSDVQRLRAALRSMSKILNKTIMTGTYETVGDLMVKNYHSLHAKAVELFPEDFFIPSLALDPGPALDDRQKLLQVQVMCEQLSHYLDGLARGDSRAMPDFDFDDMRNLGANLRDQIVKMTKVTLKTALSNIDFDMEGGGKSSGSNEESSSPEGKKRRIRINIDADNEGEPETKV